MLNRRTFIKSCLVGFSAFLLNPLSFFKKKVVDPFPIFVDSKCPHDMIFFVPEPIKALVLNEKSLHWHKTDGSRMWHWDGHQWIPIPDAKISGFSAITPD